MKVSELMSKDVETVDRNDVLSLAEDVMKMKRVRHLPVLDDGRLVAVISQRDLFHAALSTAMGFGEKASKDFLKTVAVKEVMSDELVTVGPSDDVKKAAQIMVERKLGCVPVVEDGRLVGIVTEGDFVKLALQS